MGLTACSNEILHSIFCHISRTRDLKNLMLVSRLLRCVAENILYKTIHLTTLPETLQVDFKRLNCLLKVLTARPELGNKTRKLSLGDWQCAWYMESPFLKLLRKLPRLQELSLNPSLVHWPPFGVLHRITTLQLDFSHLSFDDPDSEDELWMANRVSLEIVSKYLSLPSLRRIQVLSICFELGSHNRQQSLDNIQEQNGASSISDLRFLDCCTWGLNCDSLVAGFILSAQRLRRFAFEMNSRIPLAEGFEGLGNALKTHTVTLEEIFLAEMSTILFTGWATGNLRDFRSLKRLAIPIYTKIGDLATEVGFETSPSIHEYIPPQLEELQIQFLVDTPGPGSAAHRLASTPPPVINAKTNYREGFVKMWELTRNKTACVPSLKKVTWWLQQFSQNSGHYSDAPTKESLYQMGELTVAFAEVGVVFEWLATPRFRNTPCGERAYEW